MKALVLAVALLGVAIHSVNAATVEDTVLLTLNSTRYCVGTSWNMKVGTAAPSAAIRLIGTSNNIAWEMPQWANTDASGAFSTGGTFNIDAAGGHTLRVEIAGSTSEIIPVEVVNCGWRDTGSLNTARAFPTATLLANGKVLVTGAWQYPAGGADSAELYDPASGTWSVTGKLTTVRAAYTATLLPNGKVLVAGGYEGSPLKPRLLNSAELYDPETGTWSATGSLNAVRVSHTATLLQNGQVLVAAGDGACCFDGLPASELYDPGTGTWRTIGSLPYSGHLYQTATLLSNGKVLLVGGIDNRESYPTLGGAALYDPATEIWRTTASPNTPREFHTATLLPNGKVLVEGGTELMSPAELYDPETETWSLTGIPNTRYSRTATLLPNGKALLVGRILNGSTGTWSSGSWSYDPKTGTWSDAVLSNTNRFYDTATLLPSGKVLVAGGFTNSAELYDGGFEIPLLTLNSTGYCTGASWNLTVTHATPVTSVRLMGASNGASWEIARWGASDAEGGFRTDGTIANGTAGTHTLRVEIGGVWSNAFSFAVSNCTP